MSERAGLFSALSQRLSGLAGDKLLPQARRGFYREYTVPTPGLKHRGARRIVCGGERPRAPEACYYTADHYRSFRKIIE
mgnify:CR=1 FL=1